MTPSKQVNEEYYSDKPHSYGGKYRLYDFYSDKAIVDEALRKNDIYTRFKQHRKSKYYSPIYVHRKRELFQSDVVFFTNELLVKATNGYRYIFTTIDVFTKMAWIYPMKENNAITVKKCFEDILDKCGDKPEKLNSDRGSELVGKRFAKFLDDENIHHYLSYSDRKCPVVERFNLTIQRLLYKIMAKENSYEWTKFLDQAMKIYLNRRHRTIKMSPLEAEKEENQSKLSEIYAEKYRKAESEWRKPKYKVGDGVRIWNTRTTFKRGYYESFTREHFTIFQVLTNLPVPRYKLKDYNGEEIVGSFFEDELVPYKPDDDYMYQIEKILKSRGKGKNKQYFVKFDGWDNTHNAWVKASDLEDL